MIFKSAIYVPNNGLLNNKVEYKKYSKIRQLTIGRLFLSEASDD
jgi:hypothetical protein